MKYLLQCALLSIMVLASNPMRTCGAGHNKKYVSKTVIDTLIQQAFVNLNATIDGMPGSDFRHLQAVSEAKKTAAKLRAAAQGDPNERYILWKTGELESQILLEERDLLLQQLDKRQKEKNAIIAIFNRELGKKRPEFAVLKKSIDNMKVIDPAKTGEMQRSFDQRDVNISREIVYKLEKALQAGDPVKMQGEFDYCKKNRQYLTIRKAFTIDSKRVSRPRARRSCKSRSLMSNLHWLKTSCPKTSSVKFGHALRMPRQGSFVLKPTFRPR